MDEILIEPPLYFADDHVFDIDFHPNYDALACCQISGEVNILSYSSDEVKQTLSLNYHDDSCRKVCFSPNGQYLASGSADHSLGFVDQNGKLVHRIKQAHQSGISAIGFIDNQLLGSADEDGEIKIWDLKSGKCVMDVHEQDETITNLKYESGSGLLLTSCYDGTLGVYDLKKPNHSEQKVYAISDTVNEDLLGLELVKNNKFVLTSSNQGTLFIFKWDYWTDCVDIIRGHKASVDSILKIDENTVLTGGEDGYLRAVSVYPNQIIQIIGKHSEDDQLFPIFKVAKSRCSQFIATTSNDSSIKFYEIQDLIQQRGSVIDSGDYQVDHQAV